MRARTVVQQALNKSSVEGVAHTSRKVSVNGVNDESENTTQLKQGENLFDQPCAYVGIEGGQTINMGNYNSAKISVFVMLPCIPTDVGITTCKNRCQKLVDSMLQEEIAAVSTAG